MQTETTQPVRENRPPSPAPRVEKNPAQPPPQNDHPAGEQSHVMFYIVLAAICVVVGLGIGWIIHKRTAAAAAAATAGRALPPVPVVLGKVIEKNVPIYLDGLGTVQAYNTVTVHSRVDGELKKVAFVEGQDVHTNDLLALIDPAPYQTALEQAIGKKGSDEAQLANARVDLDREVALYAAKIDSEQLYATQKALVDQFAATVKADQAAIDSAQVNLDYCTITSPIDGRTGIRLVDQGNIVHTTDTNGLVVITQLRPISVIFTLPEQMLGQIHREMEKTSPDLKVLAAGRDDTNVLDTGTLAVIDNQIDTATGTIRLKANFPNQRLRLWPGQFVNCRLLLNTRTNGLTVPAAVIQRGPEGALATYAFVAQGEGTNLIAKQQPVTVAQIDGGEALIDSGLQAGEQVVVDGQYRLQDGSKIRLAQSGNGRGGGGNGSAPAANRSTNE
jgi:multidrug efflux system membrane fusion protein